jgi:hypothetical protein
VIVQHKRNSLVLRLHDPGGQQRHIEIAHAAFKPAQLHKHGGMHPALTHEAQMWLHVPGNPAEYDFSACPVKPVPLNGTINGTPFSGLYIPIAAWLQAEYGPDKQIVSVPINGDAHAQRLHWLHRDERGREEMRAVLECLRAWRLNDDGTIPTDEEAHAARIAGLHPRIISPPAPSPEE